MFTYPYFCRLSRSSLGFLTLNLSTGSGFYLIRFFPGSTIGAEDTSKICYKCKKVGHLSRDCQEHPDETVHGQSNGRLQENTANEMDKIAMEEDDIHEIGEEEKDKLTDVDYLTGNPLPNDILLYAVPVCGPYSALQSYKYRVKIVPGTAKKGKGIISITLSK